MAEFRMPSLGADMEQGTVVEWLVKPGDPVRRGDIVAVVDTAKAAVEVECFDTGVVERLLVGEGEVVPVGTPLALIATEPAAAPGEPAPEPMPEPAERVEAEVRVEPAPRRPRPRPVAAVPVTPIIRKLAAEAGIDLSTVHGTGRGGAITRHDLARAVHHAERPAVTPYARRLAAELGVDPAAIEPARAGPVRAADVRAAAPAEPAPPPVASTVASTAASTAATRAAEQRRTTDMRAAIAELMSRANREIPHYHLASTIDLGTAMAWLHAHNRAVPVAERLVPAVLMLKATARAAAEVGELNGHWLDGTFHAASTVDLGVATALRGGGLLVPVLRDAAATPLTELMYRLRDGVARVRAGRPRSSDLVPASITVTNLGDLGVDLVHGVIHPPQVALVGFGAVVERPWAVDGLLGVRPVVTVTLAADHRATDGAIGGRFLHAIEGMLQRPEEL
ncbi:MAG TPA: dihydrolipoamide acetyltransferase family protein [Actinophytocola sp.]|jgi:pyruvate dehydrogenase E2 component (dihydrolipoamide acetyltransferase)|uniref:dihydrolipoamide acetyltransferase family protein n=1 Tax=Actinophytocola sp. TaxID=1872138 RepID=UPI002F9388E8